MFCYTLSANCCIKKSNPAIVLLFPPNCFPYPLFLDQVAKVKMSLWPNYLLCLTWLRLLTHRGHTSCTENRSLIRKCTTCNYFFIPFCASSFNCTFSSPAWLSSQIFGIQRTAWQKRKTEKNRKQENSPRSRSQIFKLSTIARISKENDILIRLIV